MGPIRQTSCWSMALQELSPHCARPSLFDCQIPGWPGWVRVEYCEARAWGCLLEAQKCPKLFWSFNSNYVMLGPRWPGREFGIYGSSWSRNNLKLDLRRLELRYGLGSHIWRNYSSGKGLTCSGCWARASWAEKTLPPASPPLKARQMTWLLCVSCSKGAFSVHLASAGHILLRTKARWGTNISEK